MMPRRRHRRLEHVGLEPLVEKVDRAHRHQLRQVVAIAAARAAGTGGPSARALRRRAGAATADRAGVMLDDRLDEARHRHHRAPVLVVGFRVGLRVARDLAGASSRDRPRATGSRRGIGVNVPSSGRISQPVPREFQVADDLGPEQRDDVGALGEAEAGKISSVTAAPPSTWRRSSTSTLLPARARYAAASRPLWPPPMTMAS